MERAARGHWCQRFAGPVKKTLYIKTSYIVDAGAVFKVQMLSQGFKGRAK